MDPAKGKEIIAQDDLLAFNSGPQIIIEPGIVPRGDQAASGNFINEEGIPL